MCQRKPMINSQAQPYSAKTSATHEQASLKKVNLSIIAFPLSIMLVIGAMLIGSCQPTPRASGNQPPMIIVTATPSAIPLATAMLSPESMVIEQIEPVLLTTAIQPWEVTLTGRGFAAAQTIVLQPVDTAYQAVELSPTVHDDTKIIVNLDNLATRVDGQVTYSVVINDQPMHKQITVQDFIRSTQVQGIDTAYRNRDSRLFLDEPDSFGAYLWADASLQTRVSADPNPGDVVISLDDTVEILAEVQDAHTGPVYHVRVRTNRVDNEAVIGKTGWISQWLVDGQPAPPEPVPVATPPLPVTTPPPPPADPPPPPADPPPVPSPEPLPGRPPVPPELPPELPLPPLPADPPPLPAEPPRLPADPPPLPADPPPLPADPPTL